MPRFQREIVINRPVEEVFDFVTDARNEPRFNPRILLSAEKTTSGPTGRGTCFVLVSKARADPWRSSTRSLPTNDPGG
jgi:hypothetical protein